MLDRSRTRDRPETVPDIPGVVSLALDVTDDVAVIRAAATAAESTGPPGRPVGQLMRSYRRHPTGAEQDIRNVPLPLNPAGFRGGHS
jgi:hypothetical protein